MVNKPPQEEKKKQAGGKADYFQDWEKRTGREKRGGVK